LSENKVEHVLGGVDKAEKELTKLAKFFIAKALECARLEG